MKSKNFSKKIEENLDLTAQFIWISFTIS